MSPTVAAREAVPNFGIDADRLLASDSLVERDSPSRRRPVRSRRVRW